jgi:hypothetical protein
MVELKTRIFTGVDEHDATAQLQAAIADGSFPVTRSTTGLWHMWMSHADVIPGAMQRGYHRLYVTAWVESDTSVHEDT